MGVAGNFENKYQSNNPISKLLMDGFLTNFNELLSSLVRSEEIIELGAGEGFLSKVIKKKFKKSRLLVSDSDEEILEEAKVTLKGVSGLTFKKIDAERIGLKDGIFDLVVCSEVLEHVENPKKVLGEILRVMKDDGKAIISVPWEPIWRMLNLLRLKYWSEGGNTPGHIYHWNYRSFLKMIRSLDLRVEEIKRPFPWMMLLVKKNNGI